MNSQHRSQEIKSNDSAYRRSRKKSIAIIGLLFTFVLIIVIFSIIALIILTDNGEPQVNSNGTYIFYEADYEYDIMTDKKYLDLDRQIYFENPETGITVAITKEKMDDVPNDQKEYISLLCDFVEYAINGNTAAFNGLFSKEYIEAEGRLKMDFTMQQLYNIKISYIDTKDEVVNGSTYTSYDYWIEYMIRKNNGTFRNDMESDCVRKEYVRVTKRGDSIGIDVLAPYTTVQNNHNSVEISDLIIISSLALTAIITFVALSICVVRKYRE